MFVEREIFVFSTNSLIPLHHAARINIKFLIVGMLRRQLNEFEEFNVFTIEELSIKSSIKIKFGSFLWAILFAAWWAQPKCTINLNIKECTKCGLMTNNDSTFKIETYVNINSITNSQHVIEVNSWIQSEACCNIMLYINCHINQWNESFWWYFKFSYDFL